jgi:hypothetical protein
METGLTKQAIISELTRSPHKDLKAFLPISLKAVQQDPEFFAHLISWNEKNGEIRDSKVALPVIAMHARSEEEELRDNAAAHLAALDPRMLVRAVTFSREIHGPTRVVRRLVERYLRDLEADRFHWERRAVQHRASLKTLYARRDLRVKPAPWANEILFKGHYDTGSVFHAIANLKNMAPIEAAGAIQKYRVPFLVVIGALGAKLKDVDIALALIKAMSPTELTTNMKLLEKMGVKTVPALRAALEEALGKASTSKKNTLKTTKAATYAADVLEDEGLATKMKALQEKQLDQMKNVEGTWLVEGDKSGSMRESIILATEIAGLLARVVKGQVHMTFFDTAPRYLNATGKSYDELKKATRLITADGGTSIGCGLQYLLDNDIEVDGIAIVSDGGENRAPFFHDVYPRYCNKFAKEVPVYFYRVAGDHNSFSMYSHQASIELQEFDLTRSADSYSLPNLVATMRTNRYGLIQAIQDTPLRTIDEVLKRTKGVEIFAKARVEQTV